MRGAFPRSLQDIKTGSNAPLNVYANPGQYYAICADDEVLKRFKIVKRCGKIWSVPYSLLPVLILLEGKELVIKTYGVHVVIEGRNLAVIEEYLSNEMLLWVKESASGKDDGKSNVFVSDIQVRGKAMNQDQGNQNEEL